MNPEEKLELLLTKKPFHALSEHERHFVLTHTTQEDYEQEHALLAETMALFEEDGLIPNSDILLHTVDSLNQPTKTKGSGFFHHQIPTWSAAAAILILCLIFVPLVWFGDDPVHVTVVENTPTIHKKTNTVSFTAHILSKKLADTTRQKTKMRHEAQEQRTENTAKNATPSVKYPEEMFALSGFDLEYEMNNNKQKNALSIAHDSLSQLMDQRVQ